MIVRKLQLIAMSIALAVFTAGGVVYTKMVYDAGIRNCSSKYEKQIVKFEEHEREVADEVARLKKERDRLKGDLLKRVYTTDDSTGCADISIPDSLQDIRRARSPRSSTP